MSHTSLDAFDTETRHGEQFFDELDRYLGACIGVIAIRTREPARCRTLLHEWASMRQMDYHVWTPLSGSLKFRSIPITDIEGNQRPQLNVQADENTDYNVPITAMDANTIQMDKALAVLASRFSNKDTVKNRYCAVFTGMGQENLTHLGVQQHLRDAVQRAYTTDDRVYLIMPPSLTIPETLAGEIEIIDLHTPSFAELYESLDNTDDQIKTELKITLSNEDKSYIVGNALGMTQQEFENAVSLAIVDQSQRLIKADNDECEIDPPDAEDFIKIVRERKLEVLKQTNVLELMRPVRIEDVGGLDLLKDFFTKRAKAFTQEARDMGIKPPKGVVVVGPPGGGKTLITQAICAVFGQAGIRFDISKVFGSYIGQSEGQMRTALSMIEDMAPCVVQIDEIEKALAGVGGDTSGTATRVFGQLLTWKQDMTDRGIPVTLVATANDVTRLPPELLRKGRFDAIFGVNFPSLEERADIFAIHARKRGHTLKADACLRLAEKTEQFVGAEIEAAIEEALFEDLDAGRKHLTVEAIEDAIRSTTPQAKVFPERIRQMEEFCKKNARPASSDSPWTVAAAPLPGIARTSRPSAGRGGLRLRSSKSG